eukprot:scaffold99315_cov28-Prasinocladus_malaysianus.AAC.1
MSETLVAAASSAVSARIALPRTRTLGCSNFISKRLSLPVLVLVLLLVATSFRLHFRYEYEYCIPSSSPALIQRSLLI